MQFFLKSQIENSHIYVVPSSKAINAFKQIQASELEKHAAIALYEKTEGTKTTIHFDTTGHNSIDDEWPSIILTFSNGGESRLRPLSFTCKDCQQITTCFVETFTRLACATNNVILNM